MKKIKSGIYLITNEDPFTLLLQKIKSYINATTDSNHKTCGIEVLQYRRKTIDKCNQLHEITVLKKICTDNGIIFVINDDTDLAIKFNTGLHLGQSDGSLSDAKKRNISFLGSTCHQSLELAFEAEQLGADYVAFGTYKASKNKPSAGVLDASFIQTVAQHIKIDICVIGGITLDDLALLKRHDIRYFAMINGLLQGSPSDIKQKTKQFVQWCEGVS